MIWLAMAWAEEEGTVIVEDTRDDEHDTSASVTVIPVDETLPMSSDVAAVVDTVSGTTVRRLGGLGDFSGVSIRGSTMRQTHVALDGVPLNPDGSSAVNLSQLPLWAFDSVEIVRGNAPPELAAAPIGGVVNLRTGEPSGLTLAAGAGSFGTGRAAVAVGHPGRVETLAFAEGFRTQGDFPYFDDNGTEYNLDDDQERTRVNNATSQANALLRLRVGDERLRWTLLEALLWREEGVPGPIGAPTKAASLRSRRSLTSLTLDAGEMVRLRATGWALLSDELYDDRDGEVGLGQQYALTRFNSFGATAHVDGSIQDVAVPAATVSVRMDRSRSTDLDTGDSALHQRVAVTPSLSGDLYLAQDRVTVSAVAGGLLLPDVAAFTPRGGVLVQPTEAWALKANVGRYLRPPDFRELHGDRGALIGNPSLTPERGLQADIGVRWVGSAGSVEVAGFWNEVDDLILYVQNTQRTALPINLDAARIRGVEGAMDWTLGPVSTQTNVTRTWSTIVSDTPQTAGNQLPRLPRWDVHHGTSVAWAGVRVGHRWTYTSGNTWDRTNWYWAPPRNLHGAYVRVQPTPAWPSIEVDVMNLTDNDRQVMPRNVLDPSDGETVVQPLTDFLGYPLPGRTIMLNVRYDR